MKIDLRDLKENDTVFSIHDGHVKVTTVVKATAINGVIHPNGSESYYDNGKCNKEDMHPSLFHSIDECIEYFQSVKKEMDEESKPKKRYWLWSVKLKNCSWSKTYIYLDENGYYTSGSLYLDEDQWDAIEKFKHENEFIDV